MRTGAVIPVLTVATAAVILPWGSRRDDDATLQFVVWGMPFEDRLFEDGFARGFETRAGIRVEYERYAAVVDKYLAWHVLGRGPDVMRVMSTDYHTLASRGVLAPLDRFIDDPTVGLTAEERADFMPAIWDRLEVDGSRYAIPSDNAQLGLYYNRTLFERAGVAAPDVGWTWADLRDAATRLTVRDDGGTVVQYGIDFEVWSWPFLAFLKQAGGALWDDAMTTTRIDSPAGLEALGLVTELLTHTASMRSVGQTGSASGPAKLFAGGQAAMLLDGSWRSPDLERVAPDLDFAIAPLPRHRVEAIVSGSVLWAVSAHSDNPETAWRMIRWMTSREQSLRYWDTLRVAPPARLSVIRSEAFRSTAGLVNDDGTLAVPPMPEALYPDRAAWLGHAIAVDPESGRMPGFVPIAPYQKDLEEAIEAMLQRAVSPGRTETLQELLDRAAASVHLIIDRDRSAAGLPAVRR